MINHQRILGGVMEFSTVYWDTYKGIFLPGPVGERRDVSKVYTVETRLLLGLEGRMGVMMQWKRKMSLQAEGLARAKAGGRQCMTQVLEKMCFWSSR